VSREEKPKEWWKGYGRSYLLIVMEKRGYGGRALFLKNMKRRRGGPMHVPIQGKKKGKTEQTVFDSARGEGGGGLRGIEILRFL